MIETDADRLEMLKSLGESVLIDDCEVYGVFENEYLEALEGPGVSDGTPMLMCRASDITNVTVGSEVLRGAVTYTIREVEPDGTGMTLLRLRTYG